MGFMGIPRPSTTTFLPPKLYDVVRGASTKSLRRAASKPATPGSKLERLREIVAPEDVAAIDEALKGGGG
jgi:hypothetical protein